MKSKWIYLTVILAFTFTSCNDWLDVKPETETDAKEMFDTESGFKDALTSCYIKMNSTDVYGKRLTMTDIEYLAQHWDIDRNNFKNELKFKNFEYEEDYAKSTLSAIYGGLYNVISQANIILTNIPAHKNAIKKPALRAVIEGEALAIRAFCHLDILRLFGQIPQKATKQVMLPYAETVSVQAIPYYSLDDFVSLIIRDIDAAEVLMKDNDPLFKYSYAELDYFSNVKNSEVVLDDNFLGYRRFRFNYYALKAMKARLYMYLGNKEKANEFAKEVINALDKKGDKMLTLAGAADFTAKNFSLPSECILALSNFEISKNTEDLFSAKSQGLFLTKKHFEKDLFVGQAVSGNNRALNVWNTNADIHGEIKPVIKKYDQPGADENFNTNTLATSKQVIPLIRLSEMYLIAIETAPSLTDANALYDEYMRARNVSGTPLTEMTLMEEIIREYRREFFAEGQMFYTYKRLGVAKLLWKTDREVGENDYVAPLPTTEMNVNQK